MRVGALVRQSARKMFICFRTFWSYWPLRLKVNLAGLAGVGVIEPQRAVVGAGDHRGGDLAEQQRQTQHRGSGAQAKLAPIE